MASSDEPESGLSIVGLARGNVSGPASGAGVGRANLIPDRDAVNGAMAKTLQTKQVVVFGRRVGHLQESRHLPKWQR